MALIFVGHAIVKNPRLVFKENPLLQLNLVVQRKRREIVSEFVMGVHRLYAVAPLPFVGLGYDGISDAPVTHGGFGGLDIVSLVVAKAGVGREKGPMGSRHLIKNVILGLKYQPARVNRRIGGGGQGEAAKT